MVKVTRPALRYYGGKFRLAPFIISFFPEHDCYCEPFAGAASVFFSKQPSKVEVLNDLNQEIVNFFEVLRSDRAEELIRKIDLTPFSRYEYKHAVDPVEDNDPVERARRLYVRCNQARGGTGGYMGSQDGGWQFNIVAKGQRIVTETWGKVDYLWEVAARLKDAMIECDEAASVIARFDNPKTLFYVDPPYPTSTRERGGRYMHELSDDHHRSLSEQLHSIEGMVILSGYNCALYDELYADWRKLEKESLTASGKHKTECLWLSPNIPPMAQLRMF